MIKHDGFPLYYVMPAGLATLHEGRKQFTPMCNQPSQWHTTAVMLVEDHNRQVEDLEKRIRDLQIRLDSKQ